ncbi:MAG: DUF3634 family protein [Byssovorax sp.]
MPLAIALLLLLLTIPLVVSLMRANELFCLKIKDGKVRVARGRIPPSLLGDLTDILGKPRVMEGTLRGVIEDRSARVYAEAELTDAQKQQIRNVVGAVPVAKIRNAPRA